MKRHQDAWRNGSEETERVSLDRLPGLPLEAAVDGLGYGGLHQVHVAHHQRGVQVLQVLVELSVAQIVFERETNKEIIKPYSS